MVLKYFVLFFLIFLRLRFFSFLYQYLFRIILFKTMSMPVNYFDNASTTKVDSRVLETMLPYFDNIFGNASSINDFGKK